MKLFRILIIAAAIALEVLAAPQAIAQSFRAERFLQGRPIISAETFRSVGATDFESANINGPSVIRVPEWIPPEHRASPRAEYYLYFAHHSGHYIRMAWAERLDGPWQLYNTGKDILDEHRGVLDIGEDQLRELGNGLAIRGHVASPDVHIDAVQQRIVMYFHGRVLFRGATKKEQKSFVATSSWGLNFSGDIKPVLLGPSYFRVFQHEDTLYGLSKKHLFQALDISKPWSEPRDFQYGRNLWTKNKMHFFHKEACATPEKASAEARAQPALRAPTMRHTGLYKSDNFLHVFYTCRGHSPERILTASVDPSLKNWQQLPWSTGPYEILRPELDWEGVNAPQVPSLSGKATGEKNEIRDPFIFEDNGKLYLFYVGGGEQAIGLAQIDEVSP